VNTDTQIRLFCTDKRFDTTDHTVTKKRWPARRQPNPGRAKFVREKKQKGEVYLNILKVFLEQIKKSSFWLQRNCQKKMLGLVVRLLQARTSWRMSSAIFIHCILFFASIATQRAATNHYFHNRLIRWLFSRLIDYLFGALNVIKWQRMLIVFLKP